MIDKPIIAVMTPPVRKLIKRGMRLEKSLEELTTLAPIFTLRVATSKATSPSNASKGSLNLPKRRTGDQIGSPKITKDADVHVIPSSEKRVIATGSPKA